MRNLLDAAPKSLQGEIYRKVRAILDAPDLDTARFLLDQVLSEYADKAPKAMQVLEDGFDERNSGTLIARAIPATATHNQWRRTVK
ncbi:hypothetical protein AAC03nite_39000 [Alicyclobacillus acidoterrestris]|nr:hypothetical protein AAC03nite_39000 [Alicyclobacillus acidoterrestris]